MNWEALLGFYTGLRILSPDLPAATLLPTALAVHTGDAVMCRLVAHNRHRGKNRWTLVGFLGGVWALAILLFLPRPTEPR